jgi:hypothetical protein
MRVPEARSTARVGVISTPRASAEAFGAGVARGIEEVGGQVARIGGLAMEVAVEQKRQKVIREAEDGYSNWLRQANDISNTEVFSKAGAQTDHLLDDDESPENSGFNTNYTSKLDKAFSDVSANLSPNAKQRLGVMVQNQRLAYETRARNHVFAQQNEAAKYSAKVAVDVSQESAAQQARAYTKKQPDGTVNVAWPEIDRLMGDVVSAQSIYNARTGTPNEITLPDGSKKNVLAETARAGAHQKAIETLMAAGEYDEAQAYLEGLKAEKRPDGSVNPYLNDFDGKQIKAAADTIKSARNVAETEQAKAQNESLVKWQLDNPGKLPSILEGRKQGWAPEILLKIQTAQQKAKADAEKPQIENASARDLFTKVRNYSEAADPDGSKALEISLGLAELPDAKRSFIEGAFKAKRTAPKAGTFDDVKSVQASISNQLMDLVDKANTNGRTEYGGSRDKKGKFTGELSVAAGAVQSMVDSYVKKNDPSVDQLMEWYQTNPSIKTLREDLELKGFVSRLPSMINPVSASGAAGSKNRTLMDSLKSQGGGTSGEFDYLNSTYLKKK